MKIFKILKLIFRENESKNNNGECSQCGGRAVSFIKKETVTTYKCGKGHKWDEPN